MPHSGVTCYPRSTQRGKITMLFILTIKCFSSSIVMLPRSTPKIRKPSQVSVLRDQTIVKRTHITRLKIVLTTATPRVII